MKNFVQVIFILVFASIDSTKCQGGNVNTSNLIFFHKENLNYDDAKKLCSSINASLVNIKTEEMQTILTIQTKKWLQSGSLPETVNIITGGHRDAKSNWTWGDGTPLNSTGVEYWQNEDPNVNLLFEAVLYFYFHNKTISGRKVFDVVWIDALARNGATGCICQKENAIMTTTVSTVNPTTTATTVSTVNPTTTTTTVSTVNPTTTATTVSTVNPTTTATTVSTVNPTTTPTTMIVASTSNIVTTVYRDFTERDPSETTAVPDLTNVAYLKLYLSINRNQSVKKIFHEVSQKVATLGHLLLNGTINEAGSIIFNFQEEVDDLIRKNRLNVSPNFAESFAYILSYLVDHFNDDGLDEANQNKKLRARMIADTISYMALNVEMQPNTVLNITTTSFFIQVNQLSRLPNTTNFNTPKIKISLPAEVFEKANIVGKSRGKRATSSPREYRSAFVEYKNDNLFASDNGISTVASAEVAGNGSVRNLSKQVRIKHLQPGAQHGATEKTNNSMKVIRMRLKCVFWDYEIYDWSTEGCCLNFTSNPPECLCDHLTNFALILNPEYAPADFVLSVLSDVGCILSIVGLGLSILVQVCNREAMKRRPTKILINICSNMLVVYLIFVTGISKTSNKIACDIVAALLHYFQLSTWCWTAVYSYDMYMSVVRVFRKIEMQFLQRVSIFAYGFPMVVVALTSGITLGYFDPRQENHLCGQESDPLMKSTYRTSNACWIHGYALYIGFVLPMTVILLFNGFVFISVFREILANKSEAASAKERSMGQNFSLGVTMTVVFGVTWVTGYLLLISNDALYLTITSWIFATLNVLQGVLIFVMTSVRRRDARKVWLGPIIKCCNWGTTATSDNKWNTSSLTSASYRKTDVMESSGGRGNDTIEGEIGSRVRFGK